MKQDAYRKLLLELDANRSITLKRAREIYGSHFSDSTWKRLKKRLRQFDNCQLRWNPKTKTFKAPATWTAFPAPHADPGKRDQLAVLRAAAARVGPPLAEQIGALLDKFDAQLAKIDPEAQAKAPLRQPAPRADKNFFDLLNKVDRAVRNHNIITMRYRKTRGGPLEERSVAPYEIHNYSGRFYVWGTDEGDTKTKFFALDRIESLDADSSDVFDPDPDVRIENVLKYSFGMWVGPGKPQDVVVEISESRAADVHARRWPAEKACSLLANGRLRITFSVSDFREIVAWVLGFGGEAWIREPAGAAKLAWDTSRKVTALHEWAREVPVDERLMRFEWGADGLLARNPKLDRA